MMLRCATLALALTALDLVSGRGAIVRRNMIPKYPYDPETIKYCAWWLDNDGSWTCPKIEEQFELSMTDFQRWVRVA